LMPMLYPEMCSNSAGMRTSLHAAHPVKRS